MKHHLLIFLLVLLMIFEMTSPVFANEEPFTLTKDDIVAESAILIDEDTGQILFEKNKDVPMYPASTTKILTAIIIIEDCNLSDTVTIDADVPYVDGSGIALEEGEVLTVDQLLHAMLMVSANDAAEALAKHHSGTIEAFAKVMNERAAEYGALNSNFVNPHGLPNENHLTTTYDLAMIAKHAMTNETFRRIVMTPRYEIPPNTVKTETRYLNHSNKFIPGVPGSKDLITVRGENVTKGYDLMTGIKSGYTIAARHCFVGAIEKDGRRFISAIIKTEGVNMYIDTRNLLDYGLYSTDKYALYESGESVTDITVKDYDVPLVAQNSLSVDLLKDQSVSDLEKKVTINDNIELPISQGEVLGAVSFLYGPNVIASTPLIANEDFSGKDLLTSDIENFDEKEPFFSPKNLISIAIKLFIALVIWRTIVSLARMRRINKKKQALIAAKKQKMRQRDPRYQNSQRRS